MAENLFGFAIKPKEPEKLFPSFVPPTENDGSYEASGNILKTSLDYNDAYRNEADLINRYREMALNATVDSAIDDVVNEAIASGSEEPPVKLNMDKLEDVSESIKEKILDEFDEVLRLLEFANKSYDIFRQWYIDGRLFYHIVIDPQDPRAGIQEVRYIDPRKIKKVRETITNRQVSGGGQQNYNTTTAAPEIIAKVNEYYVYNVRGPGGVVGLKVAADAIAYIHSGLIDYKTNMVLSFLHKAMKPLNQLKYLEDAAVIYRLARAPERRVFKIDVGNLPRAKAEAYMNDIMTKYRTKLTYDPTTGDVKDSRRQISMLEDFWLPVRDGRGTDITTLEGGQQLGEMTDIEYFRRELYKALNVPVSRLESSETMFNNRTTEITRDELKFARFINRLQLSFAQLFDELLRVQLILKGVVSDEDWEVMREFLYYDFMEDNRFAEIKEMEAINDRVAAVLNMQTLIGMFFSKAWIKRKVLRLTDEEIAEMEFEIEKERKEDMDKGIDFTNQFAGGAGLLAPSPSQFGGIPPGMGMDTGVPPDGQPPMGTNQAPPTDTTTSSLKKNKSALKESTEPKKRRVSKFVPSDTLSESETRLISTLAKYEYTNAIEATTVEESANDK